MSQYYYAAASLPFLIYDGEQNMSSSAFLQLCQEQLSSADYDVLTQAGLADPSSLEKIGNALLRHWRAWETVLRNELVALRAQKQGTEGEKYSRPVTVDILEVQELARNAVSQESPLTAEEILNRARWSFFDELEVGHYFDIERLIIYYLRLLLLERKALFDKEKGTERFGEIQQQVSSVIYDKENQAE